MTMGRRDFLRLMGAASVGAFLGASHWLDVQPVMAAETSPEWHVLNRLTWGVRPVDVERIQQMGIAAYIEWQLAPENIPDPLVDVFMKATPILSMPVQQIAETVMGENGYEKVITAVVGGRIFRATSSERGLYELMVEFWSDHFNVPIPDLIAEKALDDREVVRKHAMGKFRDLLFASAQSPAMIVYLNNDANEKEHPNENYAREVMELHTLGVSGGYTEADVKAVARAFTGWRTRRGEFIFDADVHDTDVKKILGHTLPADRGIEDGLHVLDILATHPSTAAFISTKLIRRFVSDTPPPSLIASATKMFQATDGDIRQVMRHILTSKEFMASAGQKLRRPLDVVVALMRVTKAKIDDGSILYDTLNEMGQVPFFWHPPNGYPDAARAWMNTNGLLARWNAAFAIVDPGEGNSVTVDLDALAPKTLNAAEMVDTAITRLFGGSVSRTDRDLLVTLLSSEGGLTADNVAERRALLLGLLLASPYFQWH